MYLTPFTTYIMLMGLFAYWLYVYFFLATSGTPVMSDQGTVKGYNAKFVQPLRARASAGASV